MFSGGEPLLRTRAIERELGEGGMATVFLADDLKHERKVACQGVVIVGSLRD